MLEDFYFSDPRVALVPIEHLSATGVSPEFARVLAERIAGGAGIVAILDEAFPLYWERIGRLVGRTRSWPPPRLRNVAIVDSSTFIPPYVQLLNTSTWTLFDCDFDPATSSVEFVAYLLAHGDRMSITGEVTSAALHNAAYWFERNEAEIAEFQSGARVSTRPDAEAFAALADAIPWLRQLCHETLRPPSGSIGHRTIAGTGLLVPLAFESEPARLVEHWTRSATTAVRKYFAHYETGDRGELAVTIDWLREQTHAFVITGRNNRVLWDSSHPDRIAPVRSELRTAGSATLLSIRDDLGVLDHHTERFRRCAPDHEALPIPEGGLAQDGYAYLYSGRKILAYNLHEEHLDRLRVPSLPYARAMLGARAYHEWCHLAVGAGWVRTVAPPTELARLIEELRDEFDDALAAAPQAVRQVAGPDLLALVASHGRDFTVDWGSASLRVAGETGGAALVRLLLPRVADYQANLIAVRLQRIDEREAYVRQNIRTLRGLYGAAQTWRMFARYLYELQYLRFSSVDDSRQYFLRSTWFDADFLDSGIVTLDAFERIDGAFRALLDTFAIDDTVLRLPAASC